MDSAITMVGSPDKAAEARPVVVFIPGGPGLSSDTLLSMEILKRSFDLAFMDPPGTGKSPGSPSYTFSQIVDSMRGALASLHRRVILAGHSFGGVYAGAVALADPEIVEGIVFVSSPLTPEAWPILSKNYLDHAGPEYQAVKARFNASPSGKNFNDWLVAGAPMFFRKINMEEGIEMLRRDRMSWETSQSVGENPASQAQFVFALKALKIKKLCIAGAEDLIFPSRFLRQQSDRIGSRFAEIKAAAHFPTFDQADAVAKEIEKVFISD